MDNRTQTRHVSGFFLFLIIMALLWNYGNNISISEFLSIVNADNNAASRASRSWRLGAISIRATAAPMKHDSSSSTHLSIVHGSHMERAWPWLATMHHISATSEFVLISWSRTGVADALHFWIVATSSASTVTNSIDCPLS